MLFIVFFGFSDILFFFICFVSYINVCFRDLGFIAVGREVLLVYFWGSWLSGWGREGVVVLERVIYSI